MVVHRNLPCTSLRILEHFLGRRTFRWHHCKLDQLGSQVLAYQLHSSKRRISGNRIHVDILDERQFVPFRHYFWLIQLGNGIHHHQRLILKSTIFLINKIVLKKCPLWNWLTLWSFASFAVGRVWPDASARVFIEVQTSSACVFNSVTINAIEEGIAYSWIWMSEEPVFAWAFFVGSFWWL